MNKNKMIQIISGSLVCISLIGCQTIEGSQVPTINPGDITLNNEDVIITKGGTYTISGVLENGQIIVDVSEDEDVYLQLDGVEITSSGVAPIYVKTAHTTYITALAGTANELNVNGEYNADEDNNVDGAIFSKADLVFDGEGTLNINANYGHGIVGKDDVMFIGGSYNINANGDGINVNNSIEIADVTLNIVANQDGIDAAENLVLESGNLTIASGGGFEQVLNTITVGEGPGNMIQPTDQLAYSMKTLKATDISISGGVVSLSAYEDAIHANGNMTISGGELEIHSGDDAIHADLDLLIAGGSITIIEGYEGIEGTNITITDGTISVSVLDDALNAGEEGILTIDGGTIYLESQGDGIDCNGDFVMNGGDIIFDINAIHTGGDGNVDVAGSVTYTGGTLKDASGTTIDPTQNQMMGKFGMPSRNGR